MSVNQNLTHHPSTSSSMNKNTTVTVPNVDRKRKSPTKLPPNGQKKVPLYIERVHLHVPKTAAEASQNWSNLKGQIKDRPRPHSSRPRNDSPTEKEIPPPATVAPGSSAQSVQWKKLNYPTYDADGKLVGPPIPPQKDKHTRCLAIDCEMVGVGPMKESALARISIVNEHGVCVLDKYVKPKVQITDYRTAVSGIREEHMMTASKFEDVAVEVAEIIRGHIVIGHSVHHDFKALMLIHPPYQTRDTSGFFRSLLNRTPSLKFLAEKFFNMKIQQGEHSSIQDAQVTMALYLAHRKEWEEKLRAFRQGRRR